jgi:hypothetical protein
LRPFVGRGREAQHRSQVLKAFVVQRRLDAGHALPVRRGSDGLHQAPHGQHRRLGRQTFLR